MYYSIDRKALPSACTTSTPIPWCLAMSMSLYATLAAWKAPSTTARGLPTNVYTVLFVLSPGSTSSSVQPSLPRMAEAMASMTLVLRPSEKLGTHSTTLSDDELKRLLLDDDILATILETLATIRKRCALRRKVWTIRFLGQIHDASWARWTMSRMYVDDHYQFPCNWQSSVCS